MAVQNIRINNKMNKCRDPDVSDRGLCIKKQPVVIF